MADAFFSFEDAMANSGKPRAEVVRLSESETEDDEEEEDRGRGEVEVLCPVLERDVTAELLVERAMVTAQQAVKVEGYEQGTIEWHLSRRGSQTRVGGELYSTRAKEEPGFAFLPARLTASVFGTAVGHNKYSPPSDLVKDMLWSTVVSNEAMAYGNKMEPVACHIFETAMFFLSGGHVHIEHPGLMLACPGLRANGAGGVGSGQGQQGQQEPQEPHGQQGLLYEGWAGTSPDGIIHWAPPGKRDAAAVAAAASTAPSLLEIKCPSVNKRTFYSERYGNERFGIPHYYYDQIMGICGLNHLPDAYFVVYLPDRTQIQKFEFSPLYFETLFRDMRRFWFEKYLPAAVACAQGRLVVGQITPVPPTKVHLHMDKHAFDATIHQANEHVKELLQAHQ